MFTPAYNIEWFLYLFFIDIFIELKMCSYNISKNCTPQGSFDQIMSRKTLFLHLLNN